MGQKLEAENESRRKEYPGKEKERRSGRPKPLPELRINPSRKPRPGTNLYTTNFTGSLVFYVILIYGETVVQVFECFCDLWCL